MSRVEVKQAVQNNKNELKNLRKEQELQLKKMQVMQEDRIRSLRHQNQVEVQNQRSVGQLRLMDETNKNEQKLNALQDSLDQSRAVTESELANLQKHLNQQKTNQKTLHELEYTNRIQDQAMKLDELDQEINVQMGKMKRDAQAEETIMKDENLYEIRKQKEGHLTKKETQKDTYMRTYRTNDHKFQAALQKQRFVSERRIAEEEKKAQGRIQRKEDIYAEQLQRLEQDREKRVTQTGKTFEKEFEQLNTDNQRILQALLGKREKLLNGLQKDLWEKFQIGAEKSKDSFYDFGNINSSVSESSDGKGYEIEVPLAEHAAENIKMTGEDRTLKLLFDRRHEFTKEDDGKMDTVKKYESFVSKLNVDDIVNPKTIEKSYANGKVLFTIKKA